MDLETLNRFKLPTIEERVLILGSTGSGKTTFATWLLSHAPFHKIPYFIVDYKRDKLIGSIDRKREIDFNELPKQPGIYHLKPNPVEDDDLIEDWLLRIWRKTNVGLYIDEALELPSRKSGAFRRILTQGRSLHIPAIYSSQRPVDLNRFAFSEASHVSVFNLSDDRDRKKVTEYVPIDVDAALPEYHSYWYTIKSKQKLALLPVQSEDTILERFYTRLAPRRRLF